MLRYGSHSFYTANTPYLPSSRKRSPLTSIINHPSDCSLLYDMLMTPLYGGKELYYIDHYQPFAICFILLYEWQALKQAPLLHISKSATSTVMLCPLSMATDFKHILVSNDAIFSPVSLIPIPLLILSTETVSVRYGSSGYTTLCPSAENTRTPSTVWGSAQYCLLTNIITHQ